MNRAFLSSRLLCGVSAACCLVGVYGCSAASNLVNSNLPPVDNALHLDGQTVTGTVNGSRAVISGNASRTFQFPNTDIPHGSSLKELRHTQRLDKTVTVTVPSGKSLPTSFQLTNIALAVQLKDTAPDGLSERTFNATLTIAGPVTYTEVGTSSTYTTSASPAFSDLVISGDNLGLFRDIVTGGGTPNTVSLHLSFDTDDTALPNGSTVTFTTAGSTATIKI